MNLEDDAIKPKASTSRYTERLIINKHLLPRWEEVSAIEMKALAIEKWLESVSVDTLGEKGQEWDSLTKWPLGPTNGTPGSRNSGFTGS
jgi:hypothetical protein